MKYQTRQVLFVAMVLYSFASPAQVISPCATDGHKQFDFWLGEWELSWGDGVRGNNSSTRILDNCIIQEEFNGGDSMPLRGMRFSAYNPDTGKWQQTWVDQWYISRIYR